MKEYSVKIGVAPTRRNLFSKQEAWRLKDETYKKLKQMGVQYIDIEDINEEGLLFGEQSAQKVVEKFMAEKVDAVFFPHVNFGTEDLVAKVSQKLNVPVLLWGPRDGSPLSDGTRLTDSQCGLFATGKVLRRFKIPFNYLTNCGLEDPQFEKGFNTFLGVANLVKEMKDLKILQISTRPADFWSVICNEGELLEKFNVQIRPIAMPELTSRVKKLEAQPNARVLECIDYIKQNAEICIDEKRVSTIAALKIAIEDFAEEFGCKAAVIQCWNALQDEIGIMPCAAMGMLTDEGMPVICETDIHGAISSIIAQAAAVGKSPIFFADWTIRHPENSNGELLQHCGNFPMSLSRGDKKLVNPFVFEDHPGAVVHELKKGEVTMLRFDGDNGEYMLLAGSARVVDGPYNSGSYCWIEVDNWPRLERKLVEGPYIHHCTGVYANVLAVLYEAERYFDFKLDLYDDDCENKILDWLLSN